MRSSPRNYHLTTSCHLYHLVSSFLSPVRPDLLFLLSPVRSDLLFLMLAISSDPCRLLFVPPGSLSVLVPAPPLSRYPYHVTSFHVPGLYSLHLLWYWHSPRMGEPWRHIHTVRRESRVRSHQYSMYSSSLAYGEVFIIQAWLLRTQIWLCSHVWLMRSWRVPHHKPDYIIASGSTSFGRQMD